MNRWVKGMSDDNRKFEIEDFGNWVYKGINPNKNLWKTKILPIKQGCNEWDTSMEEIGLKIYQKSGKALIQLTK